MRLAIFSIMLSLAAEAAFACPSAPFEITQGEKKIAKAQGDKLLSPKNVEKTPNKYWRDLFKEDKLKLEHMYQIGSGGAYYLLFQTRAKEEPTIRWYVYREAGFYEGFVTNPYVIYTNVRGLGRESVITEEEAPNGATWNKVGCK